MSIDNTVNIIKDFPKARVITNYSATYNERENRLELLREARTLGLGNLIVCLDADEVVSPEILRKSVIEGLLNLTPGTAISIPFANVCSNKRHYWEVPMDPIAFVDDGRVADVEAEIHFPRTGVENFERVVRPANLKLIHLQYLDEKRLASKQRWYQAWEYIHTPEVKPLALFRKYHHMHSIPPKRFLQLPEHWVQEYRQAGVDIFNYSQSASFWWDGELTRMLRLRQPGYFNRVDLDTFREFRETHTRSTWDRLVFQYLRKTQPHYVTLKPTLRYIVLRLLDSAVSLFWPRTK